MALSIRTIPELTGKTAADFIAQADYNAAHPGTIDFSEQFKALQKVLKKSRKSSGA